MERSVTCCDERRGDAAAAARDGGDDANGATECGGECGHNRSGGVVVIVIVIVVLAIVIVGSGDEGGRARRIQRGRRHMLVRSELSASTVRNASIGRRGLQSWDPAAAGSSVPLQRRGKAHARKLVPRRCPVM